MLLGFRYVSDGGVNEGGWYVDDVTVGATLVSDGSSLAPFDSPTEIHPTEVANWNVRLVGIDAGKRQRAQPSSTARTRSLDRGQLGRSARTRRWSRSSPTTTRPSRSSSTRRTR